MAYERFKKQTNLQDVGRARTNSAAADAQGWDQMSESMKGISSYFNTKAAEISQKAGKTAGDNSVVLNVDGTITRAAIPDAGKYYTEEFMKAQQVSEITASKGAMEDFTAKFLLKNLENPGTNDSGAFNTQFRAFSKQLVADASPEIQGKLKIHAAMLGSAGINGIAEGEMKEQLDTDRAALSTDISRNIARAFEFGKNGLSGSEQAQANDEFVNMQIDNGKFLFSGAEQEAYRSQIFVAQQSGAMINSLIGKKDSEKLKIIDAYTGGRTELENAEIKSAVLSQATTDAKIKAERQSENRKETIKKVNVAKLQIAKLKQNDQLNAGTLGAIFKDLDLTDKDVIGAYVDALGVTDTIADKIVADARGISLTDDSFAFHKGDMSLTSYLNKWKDATPQEYAKIMRDAEVKWNAEAVVNEKLSEDSIKQSINSAVSLKDITEPQFNKLLNDDSPKGREARKYETTYKAAFARQTRRRGYDLEKSLDPKNKDHFLAFKAGNVSFGTDSTQAIDPLNRKQAEDIGVYIHDNKVIPAEVNDTYFDWRKNALDPDRAQIAVDLYDNLADGIKSKVTGMSDADARDIKSRLQASVDKNGNIDAGKFADMTRRSLSEKPSQVASRERAADILGDSESFNKIALESLGEIFTNSSHAGIMVDGFVGKGINIRWSGVDYGSDPNTEMVPSELRNLVSGINTEGLYIGEEVLSQFKEIFQRNYAEREGSIDNSKQSARLAWQELTRQKFSATRWLLPKEGVEDGTMSLVKNGLEKAVEDLKIDAAFTSSDVLQQAMINHMDKLKKTLKVKGLSHLDFGAEGLLTRAFSRKNSVTDNIVDAGGIFGGFASMVADVYQGKFQFGLFEGGDFGSDLESQIRDKGRWAQIVEDRRVFAEPTPGIPGAFNISVKLNSNADETDQKIIPLFQFRPDSKELAPIIERMYGEDTMGYKLRAIYDPTIRTNKTNISTNDGVSEFQLNKKATKNKKQALAKNKALTPKERDARIQSEIVKLASRNVDGFKTLSKAKKKGQ